GIRGHRLAKMVFDLVADASRERLIVAQLAAERREVSIDQRGHGRGPSINAPMVSVKRVQIWRRSASAALPRRVSEYTRRRRPIGEGSQRLRRSRISSRRWSAG